MDYVSRSSKTLRYSYTPKSVVSVRVEIVQYRLLMPYRTSHEAQGPIFIVGSSRSGTTMMSRILGRAPEVFTFNELHFFEQLWSTKDRGRLMEWREVQKLAEKLFAIQRNGYFTPGSPVSFKGEAADLVNRIQTTESVSEKPSPNEVFQAFLFSESERNGASVPCDQTPRNLFYAREILDFYPGAYFVNMIRDPRAVLLSQKNKWKRHFLGATNIPYQEAVRAWMNYHAITISKLWKSSVRAAEHLSGSPRFHTVYFEELVCDPEKEVRTVCDFLGIDFDLSYLEIPQVGSSNQEDHPEQRGIDSSKASTWEGELSDVEVYYCQKVAAGLIRQHGYELKEVSPSILRVGLTGLTFPLKLGGALLLNISRVRNLKETIKRRL